MSHGSFFGSPKTEWLTEAGADRNMRLLEDFSYIGDDFQEIKAVVDAELSR